jgi:hypothetical protein
MPTLMPASADGMGRRRCLRPVTLLTAPVLFAYQLSTVKSAICCYGDVLPFGRALQGRRRTK